MNINERFEQAIEKLYESNYYLAAEVTKLGYPTINNDQPTAGVVWDDKKKKICFSFNENFANKLNDEEFYFVVAHEALHFINMHIFLFKDTVDKMRRQKKNNFEIKKTMNKLNIAADCVVNDSLTNLYKFEKKETIGETKICYGKDIVKTDTHDMTVMNVFYLLPEGQQSNDNHNWESFFDEHGKIHKNFVDSIKDFVENNTEDSVLSDEESSQVEDMKKQMENNSDRYIAQAGKGAGSQLRAIDNLGYNNLNWNKLLLHFSETKKLEDKWTRPNRKLISTYPNVILPSYEYQEKEEIFVAIDVSGSIDRRACTLFIDVIKNSPKRFKIEAITFDMICRPYDVRSGKAPPGGGGTSFQIIENYIQKNLKKYPKAIFVLTDGAGTRISPQYPNRFCWLLYGCCSTTYIKDMKWFKINDLLR